LKTFDDQFLTVLPGRAHVSPKLFGTQPIWGWGNAWRDNREFVGKISYGVVYKLWNPSEHLSFGGKFRNIAKLLLMCQRRWESPLSMLSDDCLFYILNMCRWDWMNDDVEDVRGQKKRLRELSESIEPADSDDDEDIKDDGEEDGGDFAELHVDEYSAEEDDEDSDEEDEEESDEEDGEESEAQLEGRLRNLVEIAAAEGPFDESDHAESEAEGSEESDDGFDDHRGGSTFQYSYYDDIGSSDEEREAEAFRERHERRRVMWLRAHFGNQFVRVTGAADGTEVGDDDNEEESD
jgi:hypothetical protein